MPADRPVTVQYNWRISGLSDASGLPYSETSGKTSQASGYCCKEPGLLVPESGHVRPNGCPA